MTKRKNAVLPFKRGERGHVVFHCPQCGQELQTPIDFPGWCECPKCQREIFWREAMWIAVRVKSGKCEVCGEPVRPGGNICGDCLEQFLCGDTVCEVCGYVMTGNVCVTCLRKNTAADRCLFCGRLLHSAEWCVCRGFEGGSTNERPN
jgi:hypothetical protein